LGCQLEYLVHAHPAAALTPTSRHPYPSHPIVLFSYEHQDNEPCYLIEHKNRLYMDMKRREMSSNIKNNSDEIHTPNQVLHVLSSLFLICLQDLK
jgi:hypothetical protein